MLTALLALATLYIGLAIGYVIGQTAGRLSQQSRYEEGWRDHEAYGGGLAGRASEGDR